MEAEPMSNTGKNDNAFISASEAIASTTKKNTDPFYNKTHSTKPIYGGQKEC